MPMGAMPVYISDAGDGKCISVGDEIYVVSEGRQSRLLARLVVRDVSHDIARHRIVLTIGGSRTAVFFDSPHSAVEAPLPSCINASTRRFATRIEADALHVLETLCGTHDFSLRNAPVRWNAISRAVETSIRRARRSGDSRLDVEIGEEFLQRNYVTSQLPGPTPVYLNAARRVLGLLSRKRSGQRRRRQLTREAVRKGIREEVVVTGHNPETKRHQELLERLRSRLEQIGFVPLYDDLVDCLVDTHDMEVYYEIKSTFQDSIVSQIRLGLGQVLHYLWMDAEASPRVRRGHLIVEGPWSDDDESLKEFVRSVSVGLTWGNELDSAEAADLGLGP